MVEGLKKFFEELDRRLDKTGKRGNKSLSPQELKAPDRL